IFYHHIYDPDTPLEETALALDNAVRQGKALYVGISNYSRAKTAEILEIFREMKTPYVVNQPSYSMLNRWIERDKLDKLALDEGFGLAVFSPLYQGLLTDRYLHGIPEDSRVGKGRTWIRDEITEEMVAKLNKLNDIAGGRGQTLSQMALSWVLKNEAVTTVITGASRPQQIIDNAQAAQKLEFTAEEEAEIEKLIAE
ncbi:MAG: aldo/keto reductase, partial [Oscillospiraceae bacterium]